MKSDVGTWTYRDNTKNAEKIEVEAYLQTPKNYKAKINQHGQIDNT